MDSVPLSKDYLSSSTPILQSGSERNCKRFLNSPAKEIDALSPIKDNQARCNFFKDLNSVEVVTRRCKILVGVSRKLRFTELSNFIDVNNNKVDNDSGIGSELDLSIREDHSISNSLSTLSSTDENCNIINLQNNSSCVSDDSNALFNVELKNSKSENKALEVLDNRSDTDSLNVTKFTNVSSLDILSELNLMNCTGVLSLILSHLSDEDLRKVSYVTKEWREIVIDDNVANTRRIAYIKERRRIVTGPEKENRFNSKFATQRNHKPVLLNVVNSETGVPEQPLTFLQTVGRFDSFILESENLSNEERLTKCPKCLYASKAQPGCKFVCTRNLCMYIFCKKCMGPYLDSHTCSVPKLNIALPKAIVGSKQSRRNLRRL